ncbi:MAG: glycerophosphodiester phosphodiesterase [Chloroflexi bacterium]|nr:glycerophosphodiester phosphodiesterase [Chloroflexota bacterium]
MQTLLDELYHGRTLVFGHRGASADAPMNTLPAFELAARQGADGIELDVWRTKDGEIVIVHDAVVDKTTDGTGLVQQMTTAQLHELDAGSWFGPQFARTRIPTLDEVFEAVGQRLIINVELKSETVGTDGLEALVADKIRRHNLAQRVIVSSFSPFALRRFRRLLPEVPIGFLYAEDVPRFLRLFMIGLPHEARHPHHTMIDADYMDWARHSGYRVNTWTVNDLARAVELRDLGVDAIMSDHPGKVREALGG